MAYKLRMAAMAAMAFPMWIAASGCGGGGGSSSSTGTTLTGTVIDGPVTDATVTLFDKTGTKVGTVAKSGTDAKYSITVPTGTAYPLRVSISGAGAIDQVSGETPMDMESLITSDTQTTANVTPITSIIYYAAVAKAGSFAQVTSTTVSDVKTSVLANFGFGFDSEDSSIDPITSAVSASNITSFLKSSEATAEMVRRAVSPTPATMLLAFKAIGEDMADDILDGKKNGVALTSTMPTGFTSDTIVSILTLQKALVGVEVVNNQLKVTKADNSQISAAEVKTLLSKAINRVEPTVATASALTLMEAIKVSDKQKKQVIADIGNAKKSQEAMTPGVYTAAFTSMETDVNNLVVGTAGAGKISSATVTLVETAINAGVSAIKTDPAKAILAFAAIVPTTSSPAAIVPTTSVTSASVSGTLADGLAMGGFKVTAESASGASVDVGTTDASGQYTGFTFPTGWQFPSIMRVNRADAAGGGVLRVIIPKQPSNGQSANINPITQAIASQVLPTGSSLSALDVTEGDGGFATKAKKVVQAAFGTAIDYDTFAGKPFKARTDTDPTAGGLADTMLDAMAGMDSSRKLEDIFGSAADTSDPSVAKSLMSNPAFQARLAGELISQGRPATAVQAMIEKEAVTGADTTTMLANTKAYATSFEQVYASAGTEMTGTAAEKRNSLEAIIGSAAEAVAKIVEDKGVTSGDSLANVLANSISVVSGPLIAIGKANQGGANLSQILAATTAQVADVMKSSTIDFTKKGEDTAALGIQVKNFGEIVSSAVANSLNAGKDKSGLNDSAKMMVAINMAKGISSSLTNYMADLAVDNSKMTDAQKANVAKAGNVAKNSAIALDSALVGMAGNQGGKALGSEVINSMAQALVSQASETFKSYDMTMDASKFAASSAGNVLNNMATLVVNNAVSLAKTAEKLDMGTKAALTGAMAGQLLKEVKGLDLTGIAPPDTALRAATNMAQTMGSAMVQQVGQSVYKGSNLQVLAANVMYNTATEIKKTVNFIDVISNESLATLQQGAVLKAAESKNSMETSFKKLEAQNISLGELTGGLAGARLDGSAMDMVFTQVQNTIASGGAEMKNAVRGVAQTAAVMANAVLEKGGSLSQVQDSIAAPLAAMAAVSKGSAGQSSEQILQSIRNSAVTQEKTAQVMAYTKDLSLVSMMATTNNIAAMVGTNLTGDAANALLGAIRTNIATGQEVSLGTMATQLVQYNPNILANATQTQTELGFKPIPALVSGLAVEGPVSGGTIKVFNTDGSVCSAAATTTNTNAQFTVNVGTCFPPLVLELTGGTDAVHMTTGGTTYPQISMRSIVGSKDQNVANISPFSTLVYYALIKDRANLALAGVTTQNASNMIAANSAAVLSHFGFGVDTQTDGTMASTGSNFITTKQNATNLATFIQGSEALTEMVRRVAKIAGGVNSTNVEQIFSYLGQDISDGIVNGSMMRADGTVSGVSSAITGFNMDNVRAFAGANALFVLNEIFSTGGLIITDSTGVQRSALAAIQSAVQGVDSSAVVSFNGVKPSPAVLAQWKSAKMVALHLGGYSGLDSLGISSEPSASVVVGARPYTVNSSVAAYFAEATRLPSFLAANIALAISGTDVVIVTPTVTTTTTTTAATTTTTAPRTTSTTTAPRTTSTTTAPTTTSTTTAPTTTSTTTAPTTTSTSTSTSTTSTTTTTTTAATTTTTASLSAFWVPLSSISLYDYPSNSKTPLTPNTPTISNGVLDVTLPSTQKVNAANLAKLQSSPSLATPPELNFVLTNVPSISGSFGVTMKLLDGTDATRDSGERMISASFTMPFTSSGTTRTLTAPTSASIIYRSKTSTSDSSVTLNNVGTRLLTVDTSKVTGVTDAAFKAEEREVTTLKMKIANLFTVASGTPALGSALKGASVTGNYYYSVTFTNATFLGIDGNNSSNFSEVKGTFRTE